MAINEIVHDHAYSLVDVVRSREAVKAVNRAAVFPFPQVSGFHMSFARREVSLLSTLGNVFVVVGDAKHRGEFSV